MGDGRRGMEMVSKHGRRPRPTERVQSLPSQLTPISHCSILPCPHYHLPFVLIDDLLYTPTKSVAWGACCAEDTGFDIPEQPAARQTLPIRSTQVTTAASIAVAVLHLLHR